MAVTEVPASKNVEPTLLEKAQARVRKEREEAAIEKLVAVERKIADAKRIVQNLELERDLIIRDLAV